MLLTLAVFSPAFESGFINFDDDLNFLNNPHYRGLGWRELTWMLTSAHTGHWIPLTWLSLGVDYTLWGLDPRGYHLTSVLLHALTAAAFFLLARRLLAAARPETPAGARDLGAAAAALLFALHPLRVESVVWITERRDVLSGLFFMLTVLAYLRAVAPGEPRPGRWQALALGAYTLALLAKSIVLPLPLLLVVLDVYPLRRLPPPGRAWGTPAAQQVLGEKLPFLGLALGTGLAAMLALQASDAVTPLDWSWLARLATAAYGGWFYLAQTALPVDLVPLYELPVPFKPWAPRFVGAAGGVLAVTALVWGLRRRWPAGLAVWVSYAVLLAPVSVRLHKGHQLVADRYSYLACLGFALLVGAAVAAAFEAGARRSLRPAFTALSIGAIVAWIVGLAGLTVNQIQVWRDSDTLWTYAVDVEPMCAVCHYQLGVALVNRGVAPRAIEHLERAIALGSDVAPFARDNLGLALLTTGRPREAAVQFRAVLAAYPENLEIRTRLGTALLQQGALDEALVQFQRVVRADPNRAGALTQLAVTLLALGRPAEAIPYFERAVELNGGDSLARAGLARADQAVRDRRDGPRR